MSASKIQWTQQTWNPIVGCTIHSAECSHCYAMAEAYRKHFHPNDAIREKFEGTAFKSKAGQILWTGKLNFSERALLQPLKRRVPTVYFVNSLSDLFHKDVPIEWIDRVFAVMAVTPWHTYQVLTKRDDRMRVYLTQLPNRDDLVREEARKMGMTLLSSQLVGTTVRMPLPNVWCGVSAGSQPSADEKRENFRATPAAVKFVSYEPALGPVDWAGWEFVDQIISGGESGKDARPSHPDWHRDTRDFCAEHEIAYFFKQWGEWAPVDPEKGVPDNAVATQGGLIARIGKKQAGRLLDGVEWNGVPHGK